MTKSAIKRLHQGMGDVLWSHKQRRNETMTIQETTAELRKIAIELRGKVSYARLVRLHDRRHDLEARYDMLLRQAGLTKP
jgi:hypothetical protein